MDLGAAIRSYGGPVLFVWAWPREKRHPAIERARMLVRTHGSRVMLLMRFAYGIRSATSCAPNPGSCWAP